MFDHELSVSGTRNIEPVSGVDADRANRALSLRLERKPTLSLVPHAYAHAYIGDEPLINVLSMPVRTKANLPATNIYIKRKKLIMKGF